MMTCRMTIMVVGLAAVLTLAGCSKTEQKSRERVPVAVRVMTVEYSEYAQKRNFVGTVKASAEVSVSAQFPGKLASVRVRQGDYVRAGETLAVVESQTIKSTYDMAQAALRQAEDAYKRLQQVDATNSVAEIQMVEMETKLKQARAQAEAAAKSLEDCQVKSPFDGVVGDVAASEGVELSLLQPILTVFDISSVEVHIAVPETEVINYSVGDTALIVVPALGDKRVMAVIATKGVSASVLSHSYDFTLRLLGDAGGMMPGMVTKVYVDDADVRSIVIPSAVIKMDAKGKYVWVVENGVVDKRYIEVEGFAGRGVVVSEGLKEGDVVITEGSRKVSTGMPVSVQKSNLSDGI